MGNSLTKLVVGTALVSNGHGLHLNLEKQKAAMQNAAVTLPRVTVVTGVGDAPGVPYDARDVRGLLTQMPGFFFIRRDQVLGVADQLQNGDELTAMHLEVGGSQLNKFVARREKFGSLFFGQLVVVSKSELYSSEKSVFISY